MLMRDKRDQCGCHRECEWLLHQCDNPCRWPTCLTEGEHGQLLETLRYGFCAKSPNGEHENTTIIDPMTGVALVVCKHCGREGQAVA